MRGGEQCPRDIEDEQQQQQQGTALHRPGTNIGPSGWAVVSEHTYYESGAERGLAADCEQVAFPIPRAVLKLEGHGDVPATAASTLTDALSDRGLPA